MRSEATSEDDGYLLTQVYDADKDATSMLVRQHAPRTPIPHTSKLAVTPASTPCVQHKTSSAG